jgi:hypothetical protein
MPYRKRKYVKEPRCVNKQKRADQIFTEKHKKDKTCQRIKAQEKFSPQLFPPLESPGTFEAVI